MEKNLSIFEHRGTTYTLQDLKSSKIKTKSEWLICDARGTGKTLSSVNAEGGRHFADQIIISGSAMYGCNVPQSEFFASVLSSEMIEYLVKFGYSELTLAEIILAMQLNMEPQIKNPLGEDLLAAKFTGNFIHVSFVAAVLKNYMVLRNNLDSKFRYHLDEHL